MADNIVLNSGSGGSTLATDDVTDAGGAQYQRIKITDGTANSTTHIHAGGGVEANALRVTLASDSTGVVSVDDNGGSLTVDGTVTANLSATDNAVLDQIEVNTSFGDSVGGGTEAAALRVTLANDSTGLVSVDDNGSSLTIDNTSIDNLHSADYDTGAGTDTTTAIGLAIPSNGGAVAVDSTNPLPIKPYLDGAEAAANTGNANANTLRVVLASDQPTVTVDDGGTTLSIDDGGGSVTVDNSTLAVVGGGTEATAMRVTIASDSTGVVSIDDNGGSLTVDGTVTANLSATDNAVLDTIETNTSAGSSHYRNIDANAEAEIKGSAGTLFWVHAMNLTAAKAYLHLYDATAASVTPGTTTPNYTFPIPTMGDTNGAGFVLNLGGNGQAFANGITLVVTTTVDGSTGDPGTNGVFVNAGYS